MPGRERSGLEVRSFCRPVDEPVGFQNPIEAIHPDGEAGMANPPRSLRIVYAERQAFEREFDENIKKGGIFVANAGPVEARAPVTVLLDLEYAQVSVALEGEVVHCVPEDLVAAGAQPGVAVQFDLTPAELIHRLGALAETGGQRAAGPTRKAPRSIARIEASLESEDEAVLHGRTRNLSRSGALVSVRSGDEPPPDAVKITLNDPTSGQDVEIRGRVVRRVGGSDGEVRALAVAFEDGEDEARDAFFRDLEAQAHKRSLGSIVGDLSELGIANLIQMFGGCSRQGTLTLRRGGQEAYIVFDGGLLRAAEIAGVRGLKALSRILVWSDGGFAFEAQVDPALCAEPPIPLDVALLEATSMAEARAAHPAPSPTANLCARVGREAPGDLSKLEEALLELAIVRTKFAKVMDIIPEPDGEILDAVASLRERGLLQID